MASLPFVADLSTWEDAATLMHRFGDDAGDEAATRADHCRDKGNIHRFCHWRQIARLIVHLADDGAGDTRH